MFFVLVQQHLKDKAFFLEKMGKHLHKDWKIITFFKNRFILKFLISQNG